jgi:hypothetical protein
MKNLWTMRYSDGRLMKYDGTSWSLVGTYTPALWPDVITASDNTKRITYGCFVYRGRLWTRWQTYDNSISQSGTKVALFSGTDIDTGNIFTVTAGTAGTAGANVMEYWSNTINYRGRVHWFATEVTGRADATYAGYFFLYTFYHNGTTYVLDRRRATEAGDFGNNSLSEGYASHEGYRDGSNTFAPKLTDYRDRIMMTNPGGYGGNDATAGAVLNVWDYTASIDIDNATNNVTLSPLAITDTPLTRADAMRVGTEWWNTTSLDTYYIATCTWKEKIYGFTFFGQLYAVDPVTGTRTLVQDFNENAAWQIDGGRTYVSSQNGDTTYNIQFANTTDSHGAPWQRQPYGCKVKILNYWNGSSFVGTKYGWMINCEEDNLGHPQVVDDDGTPLVVQPSGCQFKVWWGWTGKGTSDHYNGNRFGFMFVHGTKLHLLLGASRHIEDDNGTTLNTSKYCPPWALIIYDGSSTSVTTYTNGSSVFYSHGFSCVVNTADSELHVLTSNMIDDVVEHRKISLTSPYALTNIGNVYAKGRLDYNFYPNMVLDSIAFYDTGDITPTVESVVVDVANVKATITYKLFSTTSATAAVEVAYNTDPNDTSSNRNWRTATRKGVEGEATTSLTSSSTGTSHTFVHDIATDLGGSYNGNLQYRIRLI